MQHQHSTAAGRRCLTQFFNRFRRHVRHFLGSILALFRPSGPLCFPVRQGALWASGGRAAAATGAAGGFYVLFYKQWYKNWSKVENYCFSRVSDDTLGTFWARFWCRSVPQGHCVSLSGRVRFEPREEEQQQQQEQQEGSMSHCTKTMVQKLVENYCFSRVSEGTLTLFGLDSGAVPSFRATVFPCPAGCIFSFGRKSSSSNRSSRRVLCLIVQKQWYKNWSKTIFSRVSDDTLDTFWARFWRCSVLQGHCVSLSGRVRFEPREEEQQQQQQEQQEGSMSHFTKSGIKTGRKSQTIVFLGFHKGR